MAEQMEALTLSSLQKPKQLGWRELIEMFRCFYSHDFVSDIYQIRCWELGFCLLSMAELEESWFCIALI